MPRNNRNKKPAPKTRTHDEIIQDLKDRLWNMALKVDYTNDSIEAIEAFNEYEQWDKDMQNIPQSKMAIPGFMVGSIDLRKIHREVDDSCLSEEAKEAIKSALVKAKPAE